MSKPEPQRWLIVVPVFQVVLPEAFYNFCALMMRTGRDLHATHSFDIMQASRSLLHMVMNQAAQAVLDNGYAGMVVFDDDCLPPADAVTRLMKHASDGHDFVAAMGYMRLYPYTTTVGKYYDEGQTLIESTGELAGHHWLDKLPSRDRGLIEADFCGFPLVMMSRRLIEKVEKPFFGTADKHGGQMTHDVFACRRIQGAGFTVRVDTSIECGHITAAPVIDGVTRDVARAAVQWQEKAREAQIVRPA
jgi:hypothetical protein